MCVSISLLYPILIIVFICMSSLSLPLLCLSVIYPILLLIFYVCMYIFIFYLIFYFWTDLGNVCHYNKYMEKFLTVQSSIYLQTNSKKHIFTPPHFCMSVCIFYFFTLFFMFGLIWGTSPPPHFSMSVCIFLFFTLFLFFGPIWGTFVIITNIWKNF